MKGESISSGASISDFVAKRNSEKVLFTAGPSSLLPENILGLRPCFGRGDSDYAEVETSVLDSLRGMTGHSHIVRLQGSASLALEIAAMNFLSGKVLVVTSGYYAARLLTLAYQAKSSLCAITHIDECDYRSISDVSGHFDWIVSCSTETSRALRIDIAGLADLKRRVGGQLLIDATASIGLESGHEAADVLAYSSCKGLFGLTGACFVAHNTGPQVSVPSFYLDLATHAEKRTTGPYHAIASLFEVLPRHSDFRQSVVTNKERFLTDYRDWLVHGIDAQPLLCTWVSCCVRSIDNTTILYEPRDLPHGSVICHLGEAHLGRHARGRIQTSLKRVAS